MVEKTGRRGNRRNNGEMYGNNDSVIFSFVFVAIRLKIIAEAIIK